MRTLKDVLYEENDIYVLDFYDLSDDLKTKIDEHLLDICQPNEKTTIQTVKRDFIKHINHNPKHQSGFISEFLIHLLLKTEEFQQYFQFFNLEEGGSFKKGFDGVYYKEDKFNIWFMESKSTYTDISHLSRLETSYEYLKNMMEGGNTKQNNPHRNAVNHVKSLFDQSNKSIAELFTILAQQYTNGEFESIENCQIILCGTVFTEDASQYTCKNTVHTNISPVKNKPSADCIPIAITCRVRDLIIDYIHQGTSNV